MNTFIKRLQTRASRKGIKVTMQQCREVYQAVVGDWENPLEEEMNAALEKLEPQLNPTPEEPTTEALVVATEEPIEIEQPQIIEITPENNPDIWETLQPPAKEPVQDPQPEPAESLAIASPQPQATENEFSLVPSQASSQQLTTGSIPQGQVEGMVSQAFASQSQGFKDQVTEYALQHSFEDVRQVQDFLEQLRTMEFDLLIRTLQDHFSRRDSMLNVFNNVLTGQAKSDEAKRQDFFGRFNNQINSFKREMEARLSKTGL